MFFRQRATDDRHLCVLPPDKTSVLRGSIIVSLLLPVLLLLGYGYIPRANAEQGT